MKTELKQELYKTVTAALIEQTVEHNGMEAHVDLYIPGSGDVVDWKTVKVKNLAYFPSQQQRWQVHTYGYLIEQSGLAGNGLRWPRHAVARGQPSPCG